MLKYQREIILLGDWRILLTTIRLRRFATGRKSSRYLRMEILFPAIAAGWPPLLVLASSLHPLRAFLRKTSELVCSISAPVSAKTRSRRCIVQLRASTRCDPQRVSVVHTYSNRIHK